MPGPSVQYSALGNQPDVVYDAYYFDPRTGRDYPIGQARADRQGEWRPPRPPIIQDWVLVMAASASVSDPNGGT